MHYHGVLLCNKNPKNVLKAKTHQSSSVLFSVIRLLLKVVSRDDNVSEPMSAAAALQVPKPIIAMSMAPIALNAVGPICAPAGIASERSSVAPVIMGS